MSILKTLKLTAAAPTRATSPEHSFRSKLLGYLAEQKALAEAEIGEMPFKATKKVTRTDEAGNKVRVDAPRHVRKGWFRESRFRALKRRHCTFLIALHGACPGSAEQ